MDTKALESEYLRKLMDRGVNGLQAIYRVQCYIAKAMKLSEGMELDREQFVRNYVERRINGD